MRGGPLSVSDVGEPRVQCSVQQGGCDLYGKHLTPVQSGRQYHWQSDALATRVYRRTRSAYAGSGMPPSVNTIPTPFMHHKTPISGEYEVSCPNGLILPAVWPGVDAAVVCVIRLYITSHQTGYG